MQATFFTNSFNRLPLLQNLLRSFEACNQSAEVEWIVTDYGSTDGSREWLLEYSRQASFPVKVVLDDEQLYYEAHGLPPSAERARFEAILRKYRNDARRHARGTYVFDVGSDHQFIRPADIVAEVAAVMEHREQVVGHLDLSGLSMFGYFRWRLDKPNNARGPEENANGVPYFLSQAKAYVDYSVMRRDIIERVGPYREVMPNLSLDNRPEVEYTERCQALGLQRAFLKYPLSITLSNETATAVVSGKMRIESGATLAPLWSLTDMQTRFKKLLRPVSSEELWSGARAHTPFWPRLVAKILS